MNALLDFLWRMNPFERFTNFCSSLIVVLTFFSMIYPPLRKKIKGFFVDRKNIKSLDEYKESMDKRFSILEQSMEQNKDVNITVLHDRLYSECTKCIENGQVSFSSFDNITHLYEAYSRLGGNGTGSVLYKKVASLPLVRDGIDIHVNNNNKKEGSND